MMEKIEQPNPQMDKNLEKRRSLMTAPFFAIKSIHGKVLKPFPALLLFIFLKIRMKKVFTRKHLRQKISL